MSMTIMKNAILEAFRGTISEMITTAKEFLADIEKKVCQERKGLDGYALGKPNFNKVYE